MGGRRAVLLIVILALLVPALAGAQQAGPILLIHGRPDALSDPPNVRIHLSVIDWQSAEVIDDLQSPDFTLQESQVDVASLEVAPEDVGMAVVFVIDRGGISAAGDQRIREATDLVRTFVDRLAVVGAYSDDVISIVGIGENGVLGPEENFTHNPVDKNMVLNALVVMEAETIRGGTPLYEGLDEAIALLAKNPDSAIRQVLSQRRKVIVVFSDGLDTSFSDEAREQDIIRKAVAYGIPIYTVGMARGALQLVGQDNLKRLAVQTDGLYRLHSEATHTEVLSLIDRVVTQRRQYVLVYQTRQPKGAYPLDIAVETVLGSAASTVDFTSVLEIPRLSLNPIVPAGTVFSIPYSETLKAECPLTLTLSARAMVVDGVERAPQWVRYLANGDPIGQSSSAPDFTIEWPVGDRNTPGGAAIVEDFTLVAEAFDPYLQRSYTTDTPLRVRVMWEAPPPLVVVPQTPTVAPPAQPFPWQMLLSLGLLLGLLLLTLALLRTRREFARRAVTGATGALKGVTRQLGFGVARSPGKLVIQKGANVGREYSLGAPVTKVGRDPQFCDFPLYDEYVSNPHFTIHLEGMQFYITDEASTNGTRLNGLVLQPYQRLPLPPDAVVELGDTRLQFKLVTQGVGRPADAAPPIPERSVQKEWSAPVEWYDENPYRTQPVPKYVLPRKPSLPGSDAASAAEADQSTGDAGAPRTTDDSEAQSDLERLPSESEAAEGEAYESGLSEEEAFGSEVLEAVLSDSDVLSHNGPEGHSGLVDQPSEDQASEDDASDGDAAEADAA